MTDGFTKKRVFPDPDPPITRIFLFLANFGFFGLLSIVMDSVAVNGIFIQGLSDIYGLISSLSPHLAEPYSTPFRSFLASCCFCHINSFAATAVPAPIRISMISVLGTSPSTLSECVIRYIILSLTVIPGLI